MLSNFHYIRKMKLDPIYQIMSNVFSNILILFENSSVSEIPAFAGMTDLQEGQTYRKDRLTGMTDLQE